MCMFLSPLALVVLELRNLQVDAGFGSSRLPPGGYRSGGGRALCSAGGPRFLLGEFCRRMQEGEVMKWK